MEKKRDLFFLSSKGSQDKKQNGNSVKQGVDVKKKRQFEFNKNRVGVQNKNGTSEKSEQVEKKPFDKKAYRLKKYSKKYKLEQWEEQRKKKLVRDYQKTMKKESMAGTYKPISFDDDVTDSNQNVGRFVKHPDLIEKEESIVEDNKPVKKDPFLKAKEQYNKVKQDKLQKKQEIEKAQEEKKKKLQEYKKKKQERFNKLSKKTMKGQPMMTGRLELLLEKIQKSK